MADYDARDCLSGDGGGSTAVVYLVDAVDCEGLIAASSFQSRWRVVKARIESGASCEEEAENLYELLSEIESSGAIRSTWVEKRWRTAAQRIHRER